MKEIPKNINNIGHTIPNTQEGGLNLTVFPAVLSIGQRN
tara:strand:+ start:562 stop:678 length:117 start_codon:yes stop_codon:yes gene_type:complete